MEESAKDNLHDELTHLLHNDITIINVYQFGSTNYHTHHEKSDRDYVIVAEMDKEFTEIKPQGISLQVYTLEHFQRELDNHKIEMIEAVAHPLIENVKINYTFDPIKLRHSVSMKASNSYVKAKKKLTVEKDYYVAKKSLFHSLRILNFGIQLCQNSGEIVDWNMKSLYDEIMDLPDDETKWNEWEDNFKKRYNALHSAFKLVAPK